MRDAGRILVISSRLRTFELRMSREEVHRVKQGKNKLALNKNLLYLHGYSSERSQIYGCSKHGYRLFVISGVYRF